MAPCREIVAGRNAANAALVPYSFEYTPEMRDRALRSIAQRLAAEPPLEFIEIEYHEVCFSAFRRRIARAGGTKELMRKKLKAEGRQMPSLSVDLFADPDAPVE